MQYTYSIGGINLGSDICYPELMTTTSNPDVEIKLGEVQQHLGVNKVDFPFIEANSKQYLLKLPNIARYLVENGSEIIIQPEQNVLLHDVEKMVLTQPLAALAYQRGIIPMHGGVFLKNGKGVLVTGLSGSGKSTLLAMLNLLGYTLISDDISNVVIENNKVLAYPMFPRFMLWKDTLDKLKINTSNGHKLRSEKEKYLIPFNISLPDKPVELTRMIVLKKLKTKDSVSDYKGIKKMDLIAANLYKPWMAKVFWDQQTFFKNTSDMARLIQIDEFVNDKMQDMDKIKELFLKKIASYA